MRLGRIVAVRELEHPSHHIPGITTAVRLLLVVDASKVAPRNASPCQNALKSLRGVPFLEFPGHLA
jgi:hypothetical protein